MTKIYLIRHAESIANAQGIYQGQSYDSPLSPLGEQQAELLGKRLRRVTLNAIYASPLKRTAKTAEIVQRLQKSTVELMRVDQLKEISHGEWEGKTKEIIRERWPVLYGQWQQQPHRVTFPGGESLADVERRILGWFNELIRIDKTVAVVTHGGVIQTLLMHIHGYPLEKFWTFPHPSSASVTLIESHSPAKVSVHNDTSHLINLASDLEKQAL